MRIWIALLLLMIGTRFLLVETDYLNLVLNSLALTFILEIDSLLYMLIDKDYANQISQCRRLSFPTNFPSKGWRGYLLSRECWGLFLIPIVSVLTVLYVNKRDSEPVLKALTCACVQEGDQCMDSFTYHREWWTRYWSHILPQAMHQIEGFRMIGI